MVDGALDQVEAAKPDEEGTGHKLCRPKQGSPPPPAPQNDQAQHDENVCAHMEEAVKERIQSQVFQAVRWKACAAQHVMPLQHLMQNDAVEEAPETEAEEDSGCGGKLCVFFAVSSNACTPLSNRSQNEFFRITN